MSHALNYKYEISAAPCVGVLKACIILLKLILAGKLVMKSLIAYPQ